MTPGNCFTQSTIPQIAQLIEDQFPAFYREQGEGFIEFIKAYYEWLESPENAIGRVRDQYSQYDIDTAAAAFLDHFKQKYMWGLPPELLGNQRLLHKHILELYRSKGSKQATRLLFRLLFNEDIEFYVPSYDIFKLSDNTWIEPRFFEVTYIKDFAPLINEVVTGSVSGATAVIESYEKRYVNDQEVHLLFISNIRGNFIPGEVLLNSKLGPLESPIIRGSVVGINVTSSDPGFQPGDSLTSLQGEKPTEIVVNSTYDGTGTINFEIVDGGSYYSEYAVVSITAGSNTQGTGTSFIIGGLSNTQPFLFNSDLLEPYLDVELAAEAYGFPANPTANLNSIIVDCLTYTTIQVGTISSLIVTNPGALYDGSVTVSVVDPYTSSRSIPTPGGIGGMDAVITGNPVMGSHLVDGVTIQSAGYGMQNFNQLFFEADDGKTLVGTPVLGGVGKDTGYYLNTKSFLSDDKYLFDGHYYQDFSYVIRASYTLDKYIDILKSLVHPAGNAVYGDVRILESNQLYNDAIYTGIKFQAQAEIITFTDVDEEE